MSCRKIFQVVETNKAASFNKINHVLQSNENKPLKRIRKAALKCMLYSAAVVQINFILGLNFHCPIIVLGYGDIENNRK